HFGTCGGCALQMMALEASRDLKRRFAADALAMHRIDCLVEPTFGVPPGTRRRAVFSAVTTNTATVLGFHERASQRIVDLTVCPVLRPEIAGRLPLLRDIAATTLPPGKKGRISVLASETGLDIAVETGGAGTGLALPAAMMTRLDDGGVARLSLDGAIAALFAEPVLTLSGVPVVPPPGAFAQASAEAEAFIIGLAVTHLAGSGAIADLFAGFGTFSLALAQQAAVFAFDTAADALAALAAAARQATGLKPVKTNVRDLMQFPLSEQELKRFDAAVLDPPFAGARAQATTLAASDVARVVSISCNPATFARDARILIDGGFALERVTPVDQFVFAADTEVVGLFSR
ncbi:MAG TPA: RNA methyltransferase, partial [Afifellaceae bacterium]|nr:RNA methyltransferase [Afifellaceae bacterium]